jgi:hypothetical protein
MLYLGGDLCCVGFVHPTDAATGGRRESITLYWVQLNTYHLKTKAVSRRLNVTFYTKDRTMDNAQNCDTRSYRILPHKFVRILLMMACHSHLGLQPINQSIKQPAMFPLTRCLVVSSKTGDSLYYFAA